MASNQENPYTFMNDIERVQKINRIRKAPVGAQIKRVIDLLQEKGQPLNPQQINQECYVDLNSSRAVLESLKKNPKVDFDGVRFSYKSKHDLRNKDELLVIVRKFPEGISVDDLNDSYDNILDDLKSLETQGLIWLLPRDQDVAFPNDPRCLMMKVDDDLKELFRGTELPGEMIDLEKYLKKNGMKPATNTEQRGAKFVHGVLARKLDKAEKKKKKCRISRRMRLTNSHLPELFSKIFMT